MGGRVFGSDSRQLTVLEIEIVSAPGYYVTRITPLPRKCALATPVSPLDFRSHSLRLYNLRSPQTHPSLREHDVGNQALIPFRSGPRPRSFVRPVRLRKNLC